MRDNFREISFKLSEISGPNRGIEEEFQFTKHNAEEGFSMYARQKMKGENGMWEEEGDAIILHLTHENARLLIEFLQRCMEIPVEEP